MQKEQSSREESDGVRNEKPLNPISTSKPKS